jgi:hypothetical protein
MDRDDPFTLMQYAGDAGDDAPAVNTNEEIKQLSNKRLKQEYMDSILHPSVLIRPIGDVGILGRETLTRVAGGLEEVSSVPILQVSMSGAQPIQSRSDFATSMDDLQEPPPREVPRRQQQAAHYDVQTRKQPQQQQTKPTNRPGAEILAALGLSFIGVAPSPPTTQVKMSFSGAARFKLPVNCHSVVRTDSLVILVIDNRTLPKNEEFDLGIEDTSAVIQTEIIMPDGEAIPIYTPVPDVLQFDIGVMRCLLFARKEQELPTIQPAEAAVDEISDELADDLPDDYDFASQEP